MSGPPAAPQKHEIPFEAFGVRAALFANRPELLERLRAVLPPGWKPCPASSVQRRFGLTAQEAGTCTISINGSTVSGALEFEVALMLLDSQLRLFLGRKAPDVVFVHAGAVAHAGVTLVMPGPTFTGKTTLIAALVDAGMTYYSDEFAVIDEDGRVHPYAKPLSVRTGQSAQQSDRSLESLGWTAGSEPLPVGVIVVTSYRPGAQWQPQRISAGEGVMALLANTVPARERPEQVMRTLKRAADSAVVLKGDRGEAEEAAAALLAEVERAQS